MRSKVLTSLKVIFRPAPVLGGEPGTLSIDPVLDEVDELNDLFLASILREKAFPCVVYSARGPAWF